MKTLNILILTFISLSYFAQVGKDGNITIATSSIINEYTSLTNDANSGSTSILVSNAGLNSNSRFTNTLATGDLILIHQAQGADLDNTLTKQDWGTITNYNNCGNYEYAEVSSVPNNTTIVLRCGLKNNYTASGKVQIIRVPRYNTLTLTNTISPQPWDGTTGGIIVIETLGDLTTSGSGSINSNALGFRGGIEDFATSTLYSTLITSTNSDIGGVKGESVFGNDSDYSALGGKYGQAAPGNGGGGSTNHNGGGGGGANGGDILNWQTGVGIPDPAYNAAWALETPSISGVSSSGGGKGGYSYSVHNADPLTEGPGAASTAWSGDGRRNIGGLGGRPLDYSTGKVFFGGGGGSGDMNDPGNLGAHGGNSGGIIFIKSYGNVSGTGTIESNGADGLDAYTNSPPLTGFGGNDGAGGGGAGGTIIIESNGTISGVNILANGGNGGDQIFSGGTFYFGSFDEAEGPGGGGGGGYINTSNIVASTNTTGGQNGVTNSTSMGSFPSNGATSGSNGSILNTLTTFSIDAPNDTICAGSSTTLSATILGTLPSGANLIWYDSDGNFIGGGTNYTTGNLTSDTTFLVGVCPSGISTSVSVIMGSSFSYDISNVTITNENCLQSDGSISGITISGGALPLTYLWNNIVATNQDLTGADSGNYTLIVSDANGCASTIGTFYVGENTGPVLDTLNTVLTNESCSQQNGAITGIIASGNAPYSFSWNGTSTTSIDTINLSAGNYNLTVTDTYGCSSITGPYTITNVTGPIIDNTNIIITDDACNQQNGSVTGITATGNAPYSYSWNGTTTATADNNNLIAGSYTLVVTDNFGCQSTTGPYTVNSIAGSNLDITNMVITPETCGQQNGSISGISETGNAPFTYLWYNTNATTSNAASLSAGAYHLVLTDTYGCTDSIGPLTVTEIGQPTADFSINTAPFYVGDTVHIIDNASSDVTNWNYTFGNGETTTDSSSSIQFESRGQYIICLTVTNNLGCTDETCQTITVAPADLQLPLPNVISPNNDGTNDAFVIEGLTNDYGILIKNRWGQTMFEENPYQNDWKGTKQNGTLLPAGTYYYIINSTNLNKNYTGYLMIVK